MRSRASQALAHGTRNRSSVWNSQFADGFGECPPLLGGQDVHQCHPRAIRYLAAEEFEFVDQFLPQRPIFPVFLGPSLNRLKARIAEHVADLDRMRFVAVLEIDQ